MPVLRCKALKWAIFDPFEEHFNAKPQEGERLTRVYLFVFKEIDSLPGLSSRSRGVRGHQEECQRLPCPSRPSPMPRNHLPTHLQLGSVSSRARRDSGLVVNLVQDRRNVLIELNLFSKPACVGNLCSQINTRALSRLHTCLRFG
jgi:hypothetical protein